MSRSFVITILLSLVAALGAQAPVAPPKPTAASIVAEVVAATEALLATLDEKERAAASFPYDDEAQRRRWSNLPTGIFARRGLRMGDLKPASRAAVMKVLAVTLSPRGYRQVVDNIEGDELLHERGDPGGIVFGRDEFYFSLLGTPSTKSPWMWQFGGHHLALNATVVGDDITLAPSLTGGQPTNFTRGERRISLLAGERRAARAFLVSLTKEQRAAAVLDARFADLAFGPAAEEIKVRAEGLKLRGLGEPSRTLLLDLVRTRVGILNAVHAERAMRRIARHLDETSFAWFGPAAKGEPFSFRIQGPVLIMEYAPQGRRTPGEHLHAMYRDPDNAYGRAFIRRRAAQEKSSAGPKSPAAPPKKKL